MNKRMFMSGLSIMAAMTMMGGSAFAAFTTTATATGNTFSTTTPSLTITTPNGTGTSVAGFTVGGLVPGGSTAAQPFTLNNTNTDPQGGLTLGLQFVDNGGTLNQNDIDFTVTCVGDQPVTDTLANWIGSSHALGSLAANSTKSCTMTATLHSGVGNGDAGKDAKFNAVFTGSVGS